MIELKPTTVYVHALAMKCHGGGWMGVQVVSDHPADEHKIENYNTMGSDTTYVYMGEVAVDIPRYAMSNDEEIQAQVRGLDRKEEEIRADFHIKLSEIDEARKQLLAIGHDSQSE